MLLQVQLLIQHPQTLVKIDTLNGTYQRQTIRQSNPLRRMISSVSIKHQCRSVSNESLIMVFDERTVYQCAHSYSNEYSFELWHIRISFRIFDPSRIVT